jgi:SAM-dependent methyltransferase
MEGVFDAAISDFYNNTFQGPLLINNHYGPADEMPLDVYFRDENSLNGLETYALTLCAGNVLDVGAGVGALSLILQDNGFDVDAVELSTVCCEIMHTKGVINVIDEDFFTFEIGKKYDTLLMMMNGFGLSRTLDNLSQLFNRFDELLKPGGQVLFDSSDVSYIYEDNLPKEAYFGEIDYQYEYKEVKGNWFKWLYIDINTLAKEAKKYGYHLQVLSEDSDGQYLGKLVRI